MAALAPMATPAHRLLTAWVSPACTALGTIASNRVLIKEIARIFRIEVLLSGELQLPGMLLEPVSVSA
jgi:hypothetical protein